MHITQLPSSTTPRVRHLRALAITLMLASTPGTSAEPLPADAETDAKYWSGVFVGRLKPMLMAAVQEEGPAAAISVCADSAPALARELSLESGWQIRRVSDKPRNQSTAAADSWEKAVLADFAARRNAGAGPATLNHGARTDGEDRYMQAQLIGSVCLICHGETLAPDVEAALDLHYPTDQATGYQLGQLRGAISLRRPTQLPQP